MFEEDIISATTTTDDALEFLSEGIFHNDKLCVPFNTSLFSHHDWAIIQDVSLESTLQDVLYGFVSPSSQIVAGNSSTPLPDCLHQANEENMKHVGWLQFHLPVFYKVAGSSLQEMHLCFPLDAVCTICEEHKAHNVRPRGYALDVTSLKENDCTSGVIELNADAADLASALKAFVDDGDFSTSWFLPPNMNVSSGSPGYHCPLSCLLKVP